MNWFNFLEEEGFFRSDSHQGPIKVSDGYQVPYWEPLTFLEKVSIEVRNGQSVEAIDSILKVIEEVSKDPKDNYRTWYVFIRILINIPNDRIPKNILEYIPVWLTSRFDTGLQTSEICKELLPKFLGEQPSKEDISKAEIILKHLFTINRQGPNSDLYSEDGKGASYSTKVDLFQLSDAFIGKDLVHKIAAYCTPLIVISLGRTLRTLLLDYPSGIGAGFHDRDKEVIIKIVIRDTTLIISRKDSNMVEFSVQLENYVDFNELELKEKLIESFKGLGLEYLPSDENEIVMKRVLFNINCDPNSLFGLRSIGELGDPDYQSRPIDVLGCIFRDLLNSRAKLNPSDVNDLITLFCYDKNYRLPFYKRVSLYIVGENWTDLNFFFWKLIGDTSPSPLFSDDKYHKDLFDMLSKNQDKMSIADIGKLGRIIEGGPIGNDASLEYWKLKWLAALRTIEPFKSHYHELSNKLNLTAEDFESTGGVRTRWGSISPMTKEEILEKNCKELASFIGQFRPDKTWDGPSIEGLAETLGKAIQDEPSRFTDEVIMFGNVPYIYAYQIVNGFRDAWKAKRKFDWTNVLAFCKIYISSESFADGRLVTDDQGLRASEHWVSGAVSNLLSEGMQSDDNAIQEQHLPVSKDIIKILCVRLAKQTDFEQTNMDYVTYSLNSTSGKALKSLLDYSLLMARLQKSKSQQFEWDLELKQLFVEAGNKGIIDMFILEGLYFRQFLFLDKDFIVNEVKAHFHLEHELWMAFMGGFLFGNPPGDKELYEVFRPHYERTIANRVEIKAPHDNGLVKHLLALYFWGFDDLGENSLLRTFLSTASPESVTDLISRIRSQRKAIKELQVQDREQLENKIIELWILITNVNEILESEGAKQVLSSLKRLAEFIPSLDAKNTALLLKSTRVPEKHANSHEIIKSLLRWKDSNKPEETALYLGQILNSIPSFDYLSSKQNEGLIELVTFLFENKQHAVAKEFCNRLYRQGYEFLRDTYTKYNS